MFFRPFLSLLLVALTLPAVAADADVSPLGARLQPLTAGLAAALHLPNLSGALVAEVLPDSGASRARLREGDVVVGLNRAPIVSADELLRIVDLISHRAERRFVLSIVRDGVETTAAIDLDFLETEVVEPVREPRFVHGLALVPTDQGLRVDSVAVGSPAERAGFLAGDVVREGDRITVRTLEDFDRVAARSNGGQPGVMLVKVQRNGVVRFLGLSMGS